MDPREISVRLHDILRDASRIDIEHPLHPAGLDGRVAMMDVAGPHRHDRSWQDRMALAAAPDRVHSASNDADKVLGMGMRLERLPYVVGGQRLQASMTQRALDRNPVPSGCWTRHIIHHFCPSVHAAFALFLTYRERQIFCISPPISGPSAFHPKRSSRFRPNLADWTAISLPSKQPSMATSPTIDGWNGSSLDIRENDLCMELRAEALIATARLPLIRTLTPSGSITCETV